MMEKVFAAKMCPINQTEFSLWTKVVKTYTVGIFQGTLFGIDNIDCIHAMVILLLKARLCWQGATATRIAPLRQHSNSSVSVISQPILIFREFLIYNMDGFYDGKTLNVASSPQ